MYYVVEVKPEVNYFLFVRFADGSRGRVQLAPEDFTGGPAPLREPSFFRRVFVDHGAVASAHRRGAAMSPRTHGQGSREWLAPQPARRPY
jgi:hypothetical protein